LLDRKRFRVYPGKKEIKMAKKKLFKIAWLWLILGLVPALVMLALPMASPAEAQ
jgi:hypothetical protein